MIEKLTPREKEITDLLAQGYTSREIALELGISVRTVESHRKEIYGKLQITSRKELVEIIRQKEMIEQKITKKDNNKHNKLIAVISIVAILALAVVGSYSYSVFKLQVAPASTPLATPLLTQPAYPAVLTAAMVQKAFTRTFSIEWQGLPTAISSTVPVTFTAWLDTKMVNGGITYYNTTPLNLQSYTVPGTGIVCNVEARYIYIEPGTYDLYARLRYDTGGVAVMRMDTGQVVTQVVGYQGNDGYVKMETVSIPYLYYLPLVVR